MDTKKLDKQKAIITMEPNNYTEAELLAKETEELNKIKVVNDILDAQDTRGRFERFFKDIFGSLMPVFTALISVILFFNGRCEREQNEKKDHYKQAEARYNSEIELVKFAWNDLKNRKDAENYKNTLVYINTLDSIKNSFYAA